MKSGDAEEPIRVAVFCSDLHRNGHRLGGEGRLLRFVNLTQDLSEVWDKLVYASDDAWLYHLHDWLRFTEKIWDLESKSFLVEHEGDVIGIFPLQMHKKSRVLRSIFMGTGGGAVTNAVHPVFRRRIFKAMYGHVEEIACEVRAPFVEIYLPPLAKSCIENRWGVNPLVNYSYTDTSTHAWVADLTKNDDDILAGFSHDARINIRKAREAGYEIRESKSLGDLDEYYRVHCETYHRTGAKSFPKSYFLGIHEHICRKGLAVIWKALNRAGHPVAFEIIGLFKEGAVYWAGCCETKHLHSGVNYLLQYNSMLWAKERGAKWFENGEAFPNVLEGKLRGLTTFKEKFGGELHRFYKGKMVSMVEPQRRRLIKDWIDRTYLLFCPILEKRCARTLPTRANIGSR